MRILILCYEFPPLGGGGGKVVAGLARQLVIDGHEVDILTSAWDNLPRQEVIDGISVFRVKTLRTRADRSNPLELAWYLVAALPSLHRLLKHRRYDVCNCHFIFPDGLLTPMLKIWWSLPVVLTAHGSDVPNYNPERFRLLHWLLSPLWRRVVKQAGMISCPSPTLERLILSQISDIRTRVIPNGFDPDRFDPTLERKNRIVVVSRLFKRKGIQHVIEAFTSLKTQYELHIVGDGPYRPELEVMARQSVNRVRFWGWLDNADPQLKRLYEVAAIFVLPSQAENFPVSLLEAMASGLAIITTRGTGCQDVVGDAALLVDHGDVTALQIALQRLVKDQALQRRLGRKARIRIEHNFAWPLVSQQYADAFANAAAAARPDL